MLRCKGRQLDGWLVGVVVDGLMSRFLIYVVSLVVGGLGSWLAAHPGSWQG